MNNENGVKEGAGTNSLARITYEVGGRRARACLVERTTGELGCG